MKYLIQNLLKTIPVFILISLIVFVLVRVTGDPVSLLLPETATDAERESLRESLGFNDPLYMQYLHYMSDVVRGDFGESLRYNTDALAIILERLPATLELAIASMIVAILIAIPLGILSAMKRNTFLDLFITGGAVLGKAMPSFWLGIMLILLLSVVFQIFPVSGRDSLMHLVLPAITLGTGIAAEMTRLIRSSMLEILGQDFVRTARSKGLREAVVVNIHAFRNALIPVVTIMALQTSTLIGGTLITETVFAWPGMGQLLVQAVNLRDMAVVQAATFLIAFFVILSNLLADLLYRLLDPRIKYN
ncbi:ABC transporter permease [Pseudoneobacillus rhizosphaerae]|uniref:Dipeptide transport system permease protein DppB n=1 Tax=Pseudoneobacillus rhizosphaerae TaxID=2880968 RepID=A0A9C7GCG5_9BACI|nr:ABC transporter permease [Pseudoneobacillus rhizosphaerae]CAG9609919.1 Dipeptide transport system permease protein DppB [Pseudoneobacillus rhizosphaerae]